MNAEILPVSLEEKSRVIKNVQRFYIPALVNQAWGSEQTLQVLHKLGTSGSMPLVFEQEELNISYVAFYIGLEQHHPNMAKLVETLRSDKGSLRFILYDNHEINDYQLQGNYRILGCFTPNHKIAQYAPETKEWFTGAIPVSTRDYHHQESPLYFPPVFNIEKIMKSIGDNFDLNIGQASTPEQISRTVADFYFWGLTMVHPFIGGNHRAYDRFIEYAFAKKGIRNFWTPTDNTLNIPNNNPFNLALYRERRRLIQGANLDKDFDITKHKDRNAWLKYQHQLTIFLSDSVASNSANTEEAAKAILAWHPDLL